MSVRDVESESATVAIERTAASVFAVIDDIRNVGFHMTQRSSMAMLGSKLKLEVLSPQPTGFGATYRYSGKFRGLTLDFTESVIKYLPNREKVWRTTGTPRLLIMSSYEMRLAVEPLSPSSSRLMISIAYELPVAWFWRCVGILLAGWYDIPVGARVETIRGLSAHADSDGLMHWLQTAARPPKHTFVVHGDPAPAHALATRIQKELGWAVRVPAYRARVVIE